jgi:hypothetical protein
LTILTFPTLNRRNIEADLQNAVFEGLTLQGAHFNDSNLEGGFDPKKHKMISKS